MLASANGHQGLQPPCPHPSLPRAPEQGRGKTLCSAAREPGPTTPEPCTGHSPAKVRAFLAIAFLPILWSGSVVRTNFLLGPSELLAQPLNLIITMIKVITSSLQHFFHHNNVWPLLSGFLLLCLPCRGPKAPALRTMGPNTTVGRSDGHGPQTMCDKSPMGRGLLVPFSFSYRRRGSATRVGSDSQGHGESRRST